NILSSIYTFETPAGSAPERATNTCLVVGGYYRGAVSPSYYRVDLRELEADNSENYYTVLRNHRYNVIIGAVNGPGYANPDDAFNGESQLTAEVVEWEWTDQKVIGDGQYQLIVSGDELVFSGAGEQKSLMATTTYDIADQGFAAGIRVDGSEIDFSPAVTAGNEWLTLSLSGADGSLAREINLTATANTSDAERSARIFVKAGNLTKVIHATQPVITRTFNVTAPKTTYTYAGGKWDYTVESYAGEGNGQDIPVEWTVEFKEPGADWSPAAPGWLNGMQTGGPGGPATAYAAEVSAFPGITNNAEDLDLQGRASSARGTEAAPYDLSTRGGAEAMNTANCYIIGYPGHYKLPLVYGNAVKGGGDNQSAYQPSAAAASSDYLRGFLRHDNTAISRPYIYRQFTPADATLVWQDSPGLVTSVSLTDDGESLSFAVPEQTIAQGNAVVAVRDGNGTILWSWHIWVTPLVDMDHPATEATTNLTGYTYDFMPYNLGWCTARTTTYGTAPRSVEVRFTQTGSSHTASFTLTQNNGTVTTGNNSPYWQWGRKDPMPPAAGTNATAEKTIYGDYSYVVNNGQGTLGEAVSKPYAYFTGINWTSSGNYYNLWSADNTVSSMNDNAVVKTVYDPSPAGFKMPPSNAWRGFTSTGNNSAEKNVSGGFNKGWNFFLGGWQTGNTSFYPATGYRDNGYMNGVGTYGYYWSAIPSGSTRGYVLNFNGSAVQPVSTNNRSIGYSVRCVAE
ncbi:MAG: hypothetical protein LIO68_05625, partial [Rikenellaceae bacterium]|nr:hypothetical protein [Rikenellaceae bacterium]